MQLDLTTGNELEALATRLFTKLVGEPIVAHMAAIANALNVNESPTMGFLPCGRWTSEQGGPAETTKKGGCHHTMDHQHAPPWVLLCRLIQNLALHNSTVSMYNPGPGSSFVQPISKTALVRAKAMGVLNVTGTDSVKLWTFTSPNDDIAAKKLVLLQHPGDAVYVSSPSVHPCVGAGTACARPCVRPCVRACVRARVRACVRPSAKYTHVSGCRRSTSRALSLHSFHPGGTMKSSRSLANCTRLKTKEIPHKRNSTRTARAFTSSGGARRMISSSAR